MRVLVIVNQFPLLSESFILAQIVGLLRLGCDVQILAANPSPGSRVHPEVQSHHLLRRTHYDWVSSGRPGDILAALAAQVARGRLRLSCDIVAAICTHAIRGPGFVSHAAMLSFAASIDRLAPPDAVLSYFGPNGDMAVRLRSSGVFAAPVITFFLGYDISALVNRFGSDVYARLFRRGELFLVECEAFVERLQKLGCPPEKIRIHRMGISMAEVTALSAAVPARRDATAEFVFLSVARMVAKKAHGDTVRAFAAAVARLPGRRLRLALIGDGPLRAEIEELVRSLGLTGRVDFLGELPRDEMLAWYRGADAMVLPSVTGPDGDSESIPVALSEAMAMGLPVLSTVHSGIPELVQDGTAGLLVAEHDVDALADAMTRLASDVPLARLMGEAGRQRVTIEFDNDRWNKRLFELLHEVAVQPLAPLPRETSSLSDGPGGGDLWADSAS